MGRFWSFVFLLVPVLGVGVFIWAMADLWPLQGHWLPANINGHGQVIDDLFLFILVLTGLIFIATNVALVWFMWKYDGARNAQPPAFTHGSHTLEVVWSILPAAALVFIAIYQMNAWADAKLRRPMIAGPGGQLIEKPPIAEITGRQFEWRIRYAGADGILGTPDDVQLVNDLHLPINEEIVLQIESDDVLHSFFLPHMRIKQDVVPGMKQFVWFRANRAGPYDIVCAELCGWGHYKMRGRMTIESRENFDRWLAQKLDEQNRSAFAASTGEAE